MSAVGKCQLIFWSLVGNFFLVLSVVSSIFSPFVAIRLTPFTPSTQIRYAAFLKHGIGHALFKCLGWLCPATLACSRLSVNGAYRMQPGDVRRAGSRKREGRENLPAPSYPARPAPAFSIDLLTKSLEQATATFIFLFFETPILTLCLLTPRNTRCALADGLALHILICNTVLTSPNKGETAVHCCDPALSVLVMLVSRNVFHVVLALQSIVFI